MAERRLLTVMTKKIRISSVSVTISPLTQTRMRKKRRVLTLPMVSKCDEKYKVQRAKLKRN